MSGVGDSEKSDEFEKFDLDQLISELKSNEISKNKYVVEGVLGRGKVLVSCHSPFCCSVEFYFLSLPLCIEPSRKLKHWHLKKSRCKFF